MEVPSRLAEQLAAGELDVALIPSVEYLRGVESGLRDHCRDSRSRRGGRCGASSCSAGCRSTRIERLALDEGSRTSQVLARVWLDARHGVRPGRIEPLPLGVPVLESTADAVLVIGDRAMTVPDEPFHEVVDLAEAWQAADRPAVRLRPLGGPGGSRPGRPARGAGAEPGGGAGRMPTTWRATHGPRLGLDVRDVLRLPDAHPVVRPR